MERKGRGKKPEQKQKGKPARENPMNLNPDRSVEYNTVGTVSYVRARIVMLLKLFSRVGARQYYLCLPGSSGAFAVVTTDEQTHACLWSIGSTLALTSANGIINPS